MKICFVTLEYPHPKTGTSGGIGTSILNLSKGLVQLGHAVSIVIYTQSEDAVFVENGITHYQVKSVKFKGLSFYLSQKKVEHLLNRLYQEQKIDVVEFAEWTGFSSFIQPKCPVVVKLHGSDTYFCHLDERPVKWINKFHEKRALLKATALLSVSRFTAAKTNEVFGLTKKFTIIPNGINMELFSQNEELVEQNENVILYFGSLIRKKGLLELPLIFNAVIDKKPNTKLVLVGKDVPDIKSGSSSTWNMMQALFTSEAIQKVTYLGGMPYAEIQKQIDLATVCVFPSFAEALPVSWIEAMAMQKAVVASNIGWAMEIIEDGVDGFLVNPKQHQEYANKIIDLLDNQTLRKEFGVNARMKINDVFSIEVVAKQSKLFYKSVSKEIK